VGLLRGGRVEQVRLVSPWRLPDGWHGDDVIGCQPG
jgi:hypothetical protein